MHKTLMPKPHGYIDYLVDVLYVLAPSLFGFSGVAATLCYVVAGVHFVMNLITRYPMGVVKLIPFPVHGAVELVASIALMAAPYLFGFNNTDVAGTWFFRITGLAILGVWALTDYRAVGVRRSGERPILRAA